MLSNELLLDGTAKAFFSEIDGLADSDTSLHTVKTARLPRLGRGPASVVAGDPENPRTGS